MDNGEAKLMLTDEMVSWLGEREGRLLEVWYLPNIYSVHINDIYCITVYCLKYCSSKPVTYISYIVVSSIIAHPHVIAMVTTQRIIGKLRSQQRSMSANRGHRDIYTNIGHRGQVGR